MSTQLVRKELLRHLAQSEAEVICVSGSWGVGKTYTWNESLKSTKATPPGIALPRYSYVSLFGVNSLEELKYAIFQNTVNSKGDLQPTVETHVENTESTIEKYVNQSKKVGKGSIPFLKTALPFLQNWYYVRSFAASLATLGFLSVRETLVCIDDIERRGKGLAINDFLGLVSFLKEQRKCKVVLIFNENAFDDTDKKEFYRYFEKVVDVQLTYIPTAEESIKIALPEQDHLSGLLAEGFKILDVSNIRVIKKIERTVKNLEVLLKDFNPAVFNHMARNIMPLAWVAFDAEKAPSLDFLREKEKRRIKLATKTSEVPLTAQELGWDSKLTQLNFGHVDEFDEVLFRGIKDGFFDEEKVFQQARMLTHDLDRIDAMNSIRNAWAIIWSSFDDNTGGIIEGIYRANKKYARFLGSNDLSSLKEFLTLFGHEEWFEEILALVLEVRKDDRAYFDLETNHWANEIDEGLRQLFAEKLASFGDSRTVLSTLQSMVRNGWDDKDLAFLAGAPVQSFYEVFKLPEASDPLRLIFECLQLGKFTNSSEPMKSIYAKAEEALIRIGRESPMNAKRVKRFGIDIARAEKAS